MTVAVGLLAAGLIDVPFAFAFGAGMLAAVNPCGFAMLPAYLSYFLGLESGDGQRPDRVVPRALGVGAVMTAGFILVFGVVGLLFSLVSSSVLDHAKWATIVIGLVLVALGAYLLSGRELIVHLPKLERGATSRELGSMLLFGISYAVASLSCALIPFLTATSSAAFTGKGVISALVSFVTYGLGMGSIVTALTLAVALARNSIVGAFRRVVRYVNRVSGAFVLVAGLYVAYYGWYEVRLARGGTGADPVIDRAQALQRRLASWIESVGTIRLGLVFALMVGAAVAGFLLFRRPARSR